MEIGLVLEVLKEGLKLKNSHDANKWLNQLITLEKQYYEELSLPEESRSQLYLDRILLDIRTIATNFAKHTSGVRKSETNPG
jgi:uncharacterized membrane protein YheB (UPF0754 family)